MPERLTQLRPWLARAQMVFVAGVLLVIGVILYRRWHDIQAADWHINGWYLVASIVMVSGLIIGWAWMWALMVRRLGQASLPLRPMASIYIYGNLAKYLPGSIWNFVARAYLGGREGIPQRRVWTASLVDLAIAVATGLLIYGAAGIIGRPNDEHFSPWLSLTLAALVLAAVSPPALRVFERVAQRIRPSEPVDWTWGDLGLYLGASLLTWALIGVAFFFFVLGVYPVDWHVLPALAGLWSISVAVGLVSIGVPQGIGIKEGILTAGLSVIMPVPVALSIAVGARLWLVVCDILAVLAWWAASRAETKRPESPLPDSGGVSFQRTDFS